MSHFQDLTHTLVRGAVARRGINLGRISAQTANDNLMVRIPDGQRGARTTCRALHAQSRRVFDEEFERQADRHAEADAGNGSCSIC